MAREPNLQSPGAGSSGGRQMSEATPTYPESCFGSGVKRSTQDPTMA